MGLPSDPMFIAANILDSALRDERQCDPIHDLLGDDLEYAYASARVRLERRVADGATLIGRKVGLTNQPIREVFSAREPSWGPLFADMLVEDRLVLSELFQPRLEAEVALVMGADVTVANPSYGMVRSAVSHAVAALEIVDCRIKDWQVNAIDHIVDLAASARFVLAKEFVSLEDVTPKDVSVDVHVDGVVAATGAGTNVQGDPLASLQWLAAKSVEQHRPLRAGDVVLTGSMIAPISLDRAMRVRADFLGLGEIELTVDEKP